MTKTEANLIRRTVYNLWISCLVGNAKKTPHLEKIYEEMTQPLKKGDYVVESSTAYSNRPEGFGQFIEMRKETVGEGEDQYLDTFWYIKIHTGKVYRWYNANFLRVPDSVIR